MINNISFNLVKRSQPKSRLAAPPAEPDVPTQQDIDELFSERITPETDLPPMQPLFQMFDVPCFYRGEIVADCGKAKSGKTFFLSILMAACLTMKVLALERYRDKDFTESTDASPLRVLWIDTEQSQQSTQEILKDRIIPLSGIDPQASGLNDQFYAFNLRGQGFDKRQKMVEVGLRTLKPDICIIDGVKDLMNDINDAVQATLIMEKLMALAKETNCCIVCVLHQNKAEQDRNMRGSIGTELTNKAFEVFQCDVIEDSGTFKVTQTYSRKQKMRRKLYYRVNDRGLPYETADFQEQPRDDLGRWTSQKPREAVAFDLKWDTFNQEYILHDDASGSYEWNLRKLFEDAMEGRPSRPFRHFMAATLKLSHIVSPRYFYHLVEEGVARNIIDKASHPGTQETYVEIHQQTLFSGAEDEKEVPF